MSCLRILAAASFVVMLLGCVEQEPDRPTADDKRIIKQNILSMAPDMKFKVNASLEGKVTYLGMDVDRDTITPGEQFKLTHYWKVIKKVESWRLFVHLNGPGNRGFVNADHKPIGGRYPVTRWQPGEIIRDEHRVTLPSNWKESKVMVYTGLWKGDLRMKVTGPSDGQNRILAATIPVRASAKAAPRPKRLVAVKTAKAIKVDGKLDDPIWSKTPSTGSFVKTMTGDASALRTEAKVAWDDAFLYVAFDSQDEDVWTSMTKRDDKLWTQEVVEMFIDANGDGKDYIELQVNPGGAIFDSYLPAYRKNQNDWNSKMKVAVKVDGTLNKREDKDKGWIVELAIPWKDTKGLGTYDLPLPPKPGSVMRINLFRMDLPKGKPQEAVAWSPPMVGDFHVLDKFGELVFADEAGKVPDSRTASTAPASPAAPGKVVAPGKMLRMATTKRRHMTQLKRLPLRRPPPPPPKPESK